MVHEYHELSIDSLHYALPVPISVTSYEYVALYRIAVITTREIGVRLVAMVLLLNQRVHCYCLWQGK